MSLVVRIGPVLSGPSPPRVRAGALGLVLLALALAACGDSSLPAPDERSGGSLAPAPVDLGGLTAVAWQQDTNLILSTEGGEVDFITGVNVGATVPGTQPGELAVTSGTWREWFPMIADVGFHAIRIYTVLPPHFYEEFRAYNQANPDRSLYLVHGVWIPEEEFVETADLFSAEVREGFRRDISDAVAVVHGEAQLPARSGYASGTYTADVSPWLMSWALGIEMDPNLTLSSDQANAELEPYVGGYVSSVEGSSATETWMAEMLDLVAMLEAERGHTMPLTFTNWPTTDPLVHPTEAMVDEDLVSIDLNNIVAEEAWTGGLYASYHAYPYYPDFQRDEPGIAGFELDGEPDNYAGFLAKLRDHHVAAGLPVVVLETGVPSSLGSAHDGPQGRDQGGHDEDAAMAINAELLRVHEAVGVAGGFLFEWADEWFKFTWNTIAQELPPHRRQLWHNPLTNESHFGLLAVEDAIAGTLVVDGDPAGWGEAPSQAIAEVDAAVQLVEAARDSAFLYLHLEGAEPGFWQDAPLVLAFDVTEVGTGELPWVGPTVPGTDRVVVIEGDEARAYVHEDADPWGHVETEEPAPGAGEFNEQRLLINRRGRVEDGTRRPAEWFDLNPLLRGTADPTDGDFDRRVLWNADGTTLELRLPYAMLGFSDPSSRQGLTVTEDGTYGTEAVDRVGITVVVQGQLVETAGYSWDPWQTVDWRHRWKAGIDTLAETLWELREPRS